MDGKRDNVTESRLFLLRVWFDSGWRGRLQDLSSGEACSFGSWRELVTALSASVRLKDEGEVKRKEWAD